MTAPMTPERRAEIEKRIGLDDTLAQQFGTSFCRADDTRDCLAEIDRLQAAVLAEREACVAICHRVMAENRTRALVASRGERASYTYVADTAEEIARAIQARIKT